jgi:hypothetical protein
MTSTDLYLFDDNTSKARGLCLLENTLTSKGSLVGTDGGRCSKLVGESDGADGDQHAGGQASGGLTTGCRWGINVGG